MQAMDAAIRKARAGLARVAGTGRADDDAAECGTSDGGAQGMLRRPGDEARTEAVFFGLVAADRQFLIPVIREFPGGPACGQVRAPARPQRRKILDEPFGIEPGVPGNPKSDVEAFQQRLDADGPALADGEQIWKSPLLLWALGPAYVGCAPNVTRVPTTERMTRPGISARAMS